MVIQHEFFKIVPMDLENAGKISSHIKRALLEHGTIKSIIKRIVIATYEAEINVVIHSHGGNCTYSIHHNRIHVVFRDCGPGIDDIDQAMEAGYSTANSYAIKYGFGAGMGLANIKAACDEFSIISSPQGTELDIVVYF